MTRWKSLTLVLIVSMVLTSVLPILPAAAQEEPAPGAPVPLLVTSTTPTAGAEGIAPDATLTISFNRPVVPLTGVDDQAELPQPLTLDPPVEGAGQWLTTSIYTFTPDPGWAGGTTYNVTVEPLTAAGGEQMDAPFTFSFSTAAPTILEVRPQGVQVSPHTAIGVRFSQPMDPATTEDAFSLFLAGSDIEMAGETAWDAAGATLTFTPTEPLIFGESYTIYVADFAQPASRLGTLAEGVESTFTVVALPAVTVTTPPQGAVDFAPERQVRIQFAAPMSTTTLLDAITIAPLLTSTVVYSYYNEWDGQLVLEWNKQPNTDYTVTIGGEAQDLYGNALGDDFTLSFTTGDLAPFVRVELEQFTHFTPSDTIYVNLYYRNMSSIDAALFKLPVEVFVAQYSGDNAWEFFRRFVGREEDLIWERSYPSEDEAVNESYQRILTLNDAVQDDPETTAGAPLEPGLYVLIVGQPRLPANPDTGEVPPSQSIHVIAVSRHNLVVKKSNNADSLVWLTEMASGAPQAGQEVTFHTPGVTLGESSFTLDSATTDADGIAVADVGFPTQSPWWPLIATVGEPGDPNFAVGSSAWSSGISTWDFNINGGYALDPYQGVFYTDRPIYRPGQTVHWKGIVRRFLEDDYALPDPAQPISVTIRNERGDTLFQQPIAFDALGTVNGSLELAPDAGTGFYSLEAIMPTRPGTQFWGGVGFQVATYEKPEFSIAVTPDQAEYAQGETVKARVEAAYFSGGALANAPVTWRVIAEPFSFTWDDAPAGRWFSFEPYDPENESYDPYRGLFGFGLVKEGTGTTDATGAFTLTLPADLGDALSSQRWLLDVTVQSPTNQFVTGAARVPIHRGEFYVGVSPRSSVAEAGTESAIDVVALTPEAAPVGGVDLELTIYEVRWNSVQEKTAGGGFVWQTSAERIPAHSARLRTDREGMGAIEWTPARAGQYQIVAQGTDGAGNLIQSAAWFWVSSADPTQVTAWRRENNDRITLVADQRAYAPGETARILVPNPFTGKVNALLTIERSGVDEARLITLEGSSTTIEVPITAEMIPNAFVSLVIVKGVDETNPAPALRVGMVELVVDVSARVLAIDVEVESARAVEAGQGAEGAAPPTVRPGESVTYTLRVRDSAGAPVEGAAVSVALVDKAVLALAGSQTAPLVDAFYRQRPLGVSTGATLIINRDRVSQQLGEGAKGGGGGGGEGMIAVREEFPDTALWEATLRSDAAGEIRIALALPDSLTTWVLAARAVTAQTQVGETAHELVVSQDLQVRPLLPRFFTAGDRAQIGALVLNTTASAAPDGSLSFTLEGATAEGETDQAFALAANGSHLFELPVVVDGQSDAVTVTIQAEVGALGDAVRIVVPVNRYRAPETVATAGAVTAEAGGVTEQIAVPAEATDDGALTVRVEPSLAAGMLPALSYLEHFPWECTEQTVSRFLPNVATLVALQTLEVEDPGLESKTAYLAGIGVQTLVNRQNADGGWGTWPGEVSTPFVSAYALLGLVTARDVLDLPLREGTIERAASFLERNFTAPDLTTADWELNQMAFMHYVLGLLDEGDPGRMSTLFDARARLQAYGKAWLALALAEFDRDDARIATLLDDLAGSAVQSATGSWWQEPQTDFATLNTDVRSTAIALFAFANLRPDAPLLPGVVRWLMAQRAAGAVWSNTQENAWSIFALSLWMMQTGELDGEFDWLVTLNDAAAASGAVQAREGLAASELRVAVADLLRDAPNLLTLERTEGPGALYYTAALEYWLDAPAIQPRDRGVAVERHFTREGAPVSSVQVGDLFTMTVTVVAPVNLAQLAVEVPIPAGTELVDPALPGAPTFDEFGNPTYWTRSGWLPTWRDFRDDRVALFDSLTPAGTHQYSVQLRATLPGEYRVLPARAQMLYFTEVWGRSGGTLFTVTE